jgi:hypothetical protein
MLYSLILSHITLVITLVQKPPTNVMSADYAIKNALRIEQNVSRGTTHNISLSNPKLML